MEIKDLVLFLFLVSLGAQAKCFKSNELNDFYVQKFNVNECKELPDRFPSALNYDGETFNAYREDLERFPDVVLNSPNLKEVYLQDSLAALKVYILEFRTGIIIHGAENLANINSSNGEGDVDTIHIDYQYLKYLKSDDTNWSYLRLIVTFEQPELDLSQFGSKFTLIEAQNSGLKKITIKRKAKLKELAFELNSIQDVTVEGSSEIERLKMKGSGQNLSFRSLNQLQYIRIEDFKSIDNLELSFSPNGILDFRIDSVEQIKKVKFDGNEKRIKKLTIKDSPNIQLASSFKEFKIEEIELLNNGDEDLSLYKQMITLSAPSVLSLKADEKNTRVNVQGEVQNSVKSLNLGGVGFAIDGDLCETFPNLVNASLVGTLSPQLDLSKCKQLKSINLEGQGNQVLLPLKINLHAYKPKITNVKILSPTRFELNDKHRSFHLENIQCENCQFLLEGDVSNAYFKNNQQIKMVGNKPCSIEKLESIGYLGTSNKARFKQCMGKLEVLKVHNSDFVELDISSTGLNNKGLVVSLSNNDFLTNLTNTNPGYINRLFLIENKMLEIVDFNWFKGSNIFNQLVVMDSPKAKIIPLVGESPSAIKSVLLSGVDIEPMDFGLKSNDLFFYLKSSQSLTLFQKLNPGVMILPWGE